MTDDGFCLQKYLSIQLKTDKERRQQYDDCDQSVRTSLAHLFLQIGRTEDAFHEEGGMAAHCLRQDTEQYDLEESDNES